MFLYKNKNFSIYFGDSKDQINKQLYIKHKQDYFLLNNCFKSVQKNLNINKFFFLNQTHSTKGTLVDALKIEQDSSFSIEGDYLITNLKKIAIGVMTADCLPIVLYDKAKHIAAIVHAGWRGSVAMIVKKVIEQMEQYFKSDKSKINVFLGPCAQICCYEVGTDFIEKLKCFDKYSFLIHKKNKKFYFDLPLFNEFILQENGIKKQNINKKYNVCTICNPSFCSYRREKTNFRQMSLVSLY